MKAITVGRSRDILRLIGAIASGYLLSLGFEPVSFWLAPPVALFLIILLSKGRALPLRMALWYLFGLSFLAPLLHWTSIYVGAAPWLVLVFGQSFFFLLPALGLRNRKLDPIFFTALFAIAEFLRATIPFGGFGWGRIGFSQLDGPYQAWLRVGGVALVGAVIAFTVSSLLSTWRWRSFSALILFTGLIYGSVGTASALSNAEFNENAVRIGLVQGGVSQLGLDFNATPREVFERHFKQTERLLHRKDLDLIVWPENASDLDPTSDKEISKRIDSILEEAQVPLLIGAVTQSPQGPENVSILYEYGRGEVSRYQKRDLVPFGEYIPLRSLVKNLSSLVDGIKDFVPGKEATVQKIAGMRFVPMICYEVLDDEIAHSAIAASNIGVVQTNNATFGRSPQSAQQFEMTRVRAYESRIPIIVAATTGRTALIDGDGKVVKSLEDFVSDVLVIETSPQDPSIPPLKTEYLFSVSLIFCAFSFIRALKRRERGSKVMI